MDKGLVHLVDDDEAIRSSLGFLLTTAGYGVRPWASGDIFLQRADNSVPACLLLDMRMPGLDGIEVQARLLGAGLDFPVIMLTGHGDIALAVQATKAGASDFLEKPCDGARLLGSLETAFGQLADREARLAQLRQAGALLAGLTEREREVLDGLSCGFPNKTIAYDLGISSRTVEIYRARVMGKLGVGNFAEALRIAFAAGLGSQLAWREAHRLVKGETPKSRACENTQATRVPGIDED